MATLSKSVIVRLATADDLPAVHSLIRESFAALGDHYSPEATMVYSSAAETAIARYTFRSVDLSTGIFLSHGTDCREFSH